MTDSLIPPDGASLTAPALCTCNSDGAYGPTLGHYPGTLAALRQAYAVHGPAYESDGLTLYQGDCLDVLPRLPAESVNVVITSPPFWGLRVYAGCPPSVWGGDPACPHTLAAAPMPGESYADRRKWQHEQRKAGAEQAVMAL